MMMRVAVALLGCILVAAACAAAADGPNLVREPGFEEGTQDWGRPAPLYALDDTVAHSGHRSLKFHNEPGGPYLLASQEIPLKPGRCYRMSVWVKTEGIVSEDTGAAICLEWHGTNGYIGGSYPPGVKGTADWQQIEFITGAVPPNATGGSVTCYGRSGTSGTAWFDDVEVVELPGSVARFGFEGLATEVRRQSVFSELETPQVRVRAELLPGSGLKPGDLALAATLHAGGWQQEVRSDEWQGETATLAIPTAQLPQTETAMEVSLVSRATGRPVIGEFLWVTRLCPLRLDIVRPNSAGVIGVTGGDEPDITARVVVTPADALRPRTYRARVGLVVGGKPFGRWAEAPVSDAKPTLVRVSTKGLPYGLHELRCEIRAAGSEQVVAAVQAAVTEADPRQRPANATSIGANRMLQVDGKPFFPMGFYMLSSFETVFPADQAYKWLTGKLCPSYYVPILDRLSKSHFNCVMDYGSTLGGMDAARQFLDAAQQRKVHVIFSVKDLMKGAYWQEYTRNLPWKDLGEATRGVVGGLRKHPAVIAWYINDEVFQPDAWQGAVDVFHSVRATDPWHPTWAVHYDFKGIPKYRTACDVIGTDPYTVMGDIGVTATSWHECRQNMPPEQPFWAVVQSFGNGYEFSHPSDTREPSCDEERAATFAAIAEGSTGIVYYCFHSMQRSPRFEERFAELDKIAGEVQRLVPIIALPDAQRPVRVAQGTLSALTKQGDGKRYVILASTKRDDQDVVLHVPGRAKAVRDMATGEALKLKAGQVSMRFKALDARVVEVE